MRWVVRVLALLVLIGLIASVLPYFGTNAWWVRMATYPRVQVFAGLALLLVLLAALPGRFRPLSLAALLLALVGMAVQAHALWPYTGLHDLRIVAARACPAERQLRVVAVNVQMTNENADELFAILRQADPDLILFQETDAWWHEHLKALSNEYPYAVQHVTQNYFGIYMLSRYPLVDPQVHFLTGSRDPSIVTGVRLPSGDVVRFYGVHPRPPEEGQSSAERDGQILAAALAIRGDGAPSLLAGDMNATPWSRVMRHAARVGELLEPRIGRGWTPTFRAGSLVMTWPLDHVLAGDEFSLVSFDALRSFQSDHRPIMATLCLEPGVAARQSAPPLRHGDLERAAEAAGQGQDKATPSPEPAPEKQVPGQGSG